MFLAGAGKVEKLGDGGVPVGRHTAIPWRQRLRLLVVAQFESRINATSTRRGIQQAIALREPTSPWKFPQLVVTPELVDQYVFNSILQQPGRNLKPSHRIYQLSTDSLDGMDKVSG